MMMRRQSGLERQKQLADAGELTTAHCHEIAPPSQLAPSKELAMRRIAIGTIVASTCLVLAFPTSSVAQDAERDPVWRHTAGSEIFLVKPTPIGTVIVSTLERTVSLDQETGAVRWSSEVLRDCRDFRRVGFVGKREPVRPPLCRVGDRDGYTLHDLGPLAILTHRDHMVAFDLVQGVELWNSEQAGLEMSPDGWALRPDLALALFWREDRKAGTTVVGLELVTGTRRWTAELPMVRDVELINTRSSALFRGRPASGPDVVVSVRLCDGTMSAPSSELGAAFDHQLRTLLTLSPQSVLNSPEIDLRSPNGNLLEVVHTGRKVLTAFDPEAAELRWSARDIDRKSWVYDSTALYVADGNNVSALSLVDGSVLWSARERATRLTLTRQGLVLGCDIHVCEDRVLLLDPDNGSRLWTEYVRIGGPGARVAWRDSLLLLALPDGASRLDLAGGEYTRLANIGFKGDDSPLSIIDLGDGFAIIGKENVAGVAENGSLRYHEFYSAPGMSGTEKALRIVASVALTAASAANAQMSANRMARTGAFIDAANGGPGLGVGFAAFQTFYPNFDRRYTQAEKVSTDVYFYTERPGPAGRTGFALVQFDTRAGVEIARLWIDERHPKYELDPVTRLAFLRRSDGTLEAHKLEP
jgi:outer membrane protein assembly factor BamB